MAKDPDDRLYDSLVELGYPGVELKSLGRQVVAPGSKHPDTERVYEAVGAWKKPLPKIPGGLRELALKRSRTEASTDSDTVGVLTCERLAEVLSQNFRAIRDHRNGWMI
jgi:hypothetical protein